MQMILLRFILVVSLLRPIVYAPFNLYDTDRVFGTGRLQFDCLHYYVGSESIDLRIDNSVKQVIKYCIRPMDETGAPLSNNNTHTKNFTFKELRHLNVTVQQLLSWSASIDLVERYLLYVSQSLINVSSSNESFYNCTSPWFGSRCQYSFVSDGDQSFSVIVETKFSRMKIYKQHGVDLSNLTCYKHLKCDRGGLHLCLDWREVCNGRIDCIDGGDDEAHCFEMEMNECDEDEYRCHNGLCIPKDFWQDDENNPDCLDRSDEPDISSSFDLCFQDHTFRCEEHSCRPGKTDFPCGDGQCVKDFDSCENGRTNLLEQSLLAIDDLSDECWIYLACFALIIHNYNRDLCRYVIRSLDINNTSHLSTCEPLIQFPTIYALNGHVRFLYRKNRSVAFAKKTFIDGEDIESIFPLTLNNNRGIPGSSILNTGSLGTSIFNTGSSGTSIFNTGSSGTLSNHINILGSLSSNYVLVKLAIDECSLEGSTSTQFGFNMLPPRPNSSFFGPECFSIDSIGTLIYFNIILPDYVCYDENLCDFILPTFSHNNLNCLHRHQMKIADTRDYVDFTLAVKDYFRGRSTAYKTEHDNQFRLHPSLYCCQNSSKCISKHRLVDGIIDCHMGDDETYESSCSLNDTYRFKCGQKDNQYFSPIVSTDICRKQLKDSINEIYFQKICNGVADIFPQEVDGNKYTDETECEYWPCDNIYTRCDNIWACHDGRDEDDCIQSECPSRSRPCISSQNYTLMCLPLNRVNDGIIDCLGASDEIGYCINKNYSLPDENTFWCSHEERCIASSSLCDGYNDCFPSHHDEIFCESKQEICSKSEIDNRTQIEKIICQIFGENKDNAYFSLKTSPVYPSSVKNTSLQFDERPAERILIRRNIEEFDYDYEYEPNDFAWTQHCNRGLYARTSLGSENDGYSCFCPPSYYGDSCQYQNQRVSLTLRLLPVDRHSVYAIFIKLIDENGQINSYEQFTFMAVWGCKVKFNIYLLYSTRPKDIFKNYSVHIDAFDKSNLIHNASWYLSIPFIFLPVNRLVAQLTLPVQRTIIPDSCNLTCNNGGQCMKYENTQEFFCRCPANWTGNRCEIPIECDDCSSDSICVGSANNRSICVCPSNKAGPRCLLPSMCPLNACKNGGRCVLIDDNIGTNNYICICSDEYYGLQCEQSKRKLNIFLDNIQTPSHVQVFINTVSNESQPSSFIMMKKLAHDQNTLSFYISKPFHMVFIKITDDYYLAVVQQNPNHDISTSISPTQRCHPIHELFNSTVLTLPPIRRIKYYPLLCRNRTEPWCFFDENYMCLCTLEHYPNCFQFNHQAKLTCKQSGYCKNGALCLQDDPTCLSNIICICTDCYFGTQCQFYAKGFGLTLDDILRYEIRPNLTFPQQRMSVKISVIITMIMFVLGIINGIFSCLTFMRKNSKVVGCGLYLFASSITSILTIIVFTLKFWFLVLSQMNIITNRTVLRIGCVSVEPLLKIFLFTDTWFNACVAIERAISVFKGIKFDKLNSKRVAKRIIFVLPLLIILTLIHEPIHRDLFDDEEEQRTWCVTDYSQYLQEYNSAIILLHFLIPFIINLSSALFIIINAARRRSVSQTQQSYSEHLRKQFAEHKHILISPLALVILSSPRLIISLMSTCIKSSRDPWLYLCGYFISFIPSMLIFIVFVLPSELYSKEFKETIKIW